ncbi:MAG: hypothetical protein WCX65_17170 [bacterium]
MKKATTIKAMLMASLIATATLLAGCGGGGGGVASVSGGKGTMKLKLEMPRTALTAGETSTISANGTITVNSYCAGGSETSVASANTAFTQACTYGDTYSCTQTGGDFFITQIPSGNNYVVKAQLAMTSSYSGAGRVANNGSSSYTYYYGAIVNSVASGLTTNVTVNGESTVAALLTMRYAETKSAAMSDTSVITAGVIWAIADYVESHTGAGVTTGVIYPSSFNCIYSETTCLDPFLRANWTTGFRDSLDAILANIEMPTIGCSGTAAAYVATAKANIFKSEISSTDFNNAKTAADAALAASPYCPDANLISAILDIGGEADRVETQVMANGSTVFPYLLGYSTPATYGLRAAGAVIDPVMNALPRYAQTGTITSSSLPSEMQAAAIASLTVLEGAIAKLSLVKSLTASDLAAWSFTYPKDPANPSLGNVAIDANDVDLINGAVKFAAGLAYYGMSFNLDIPTSYSTTDPCPVYTYSGYPPEQELDTSMSALREFNTCSAADINEDNIITPAEYFPGPSTFGTRTANATTYLTKAQSLINGGLSLLDTAVTNKLAAVTTQLGGVSLTSEAIADANHYKHYLTELAASFAGTTTNMTMPAESDCWQSSGGMYAYYYPDTVTDPAYNTGDLTGCLFAYQTMDPATIPLNLGALFNITDFRNAATNYTIDSSGEINSSVASATLGGLIPGGVQTSWFNFKTAEFHFNFQNMVSSTGGTIISSLPSTGITLTIGSKTLTPNSSYAGTGFNYMMFYSNIITVPTANDYITVNEMVPVTATLTVPGYQPKQISVIGDSYSSTSLALTPLP